MGQAAVPTIESPSQKIRTMGSSIEDKSSDDDTFLEDLLSKMTLEEKIGQMSQMEINMLVVEDPNDPGHMTLDRDQATHYIGEMGIGSVLNILPSSGNQAWSATEYRKIAMELQQIAKDHGRPPVIWGLDSKKNHRAFF